MMRQQMLFERQRQLLTAELQRRQIKAAQIRRITTAQMHYQKMTQKYLEVRWLLTSSVIPQGALPRMHKDLMLLITSF